MSKKNTHNGPPLLGRIEERLAELPDQLEKLKLFLDDYPNFTNLLMLDVRTIMSKGRGLLLAIYQILGEAGITFTNKK